VGDEKEKHTDGIYDDDQTGVEAVDPASFLGSWMLG
jgi:hypothetical protein